MGSMRIYSGHLLVILWIRSKEPACELRLATGGIQGGGERAQDAIRASSPHAVSACSTGINMGCTPATLFLAHRLILKLKESTDVSRDGES